SISFRTNAFPTMTVDAAGRIYVAWSQRGIGPAGAARIVISTSTDGVSWSVPRPVDSVGNTPGHQIMPALVFASGKLMLVYYDQREDETVGELRCLSVLCTSTAPGARTTAMLDEVRRQDGD